LICSANELDPAPDKQWLGRSFIHAKLWRRHESKEALMCQRSPPAHRLAGTRESKRGQMKTAQQWLAAYAANHRNPINQRIHRVCVPAILFSVLGLAWHVQIVGIVDLWWANGAIVLSLLALAFYWWLGMWPCLTMAVTFAVIIAMVMGLEWGTSLPTVSLYTTIFALAWIAQLIGHKVEGGPPSFLEDMQFLLIGPLWVFYH
jgi:uncharacterized membrane protein YGL010W